MVARTDPNLTDKLCALIVAHFGIPHEAAKSMTRKQILGLVAWDHYPVPVAVAKANGWAPDAYNHPSNLQAMIHEDHGLKTAKKDVPEIAKADRISAANEEFRRRILAKSGQGDAPPQPRSKWGNRKMQSRGFPKKQRQA